MSGKKKKSEKLLEENEPQVFGLDVEEDDDTLLPPDQIPTGNTTEESNEKPETTNSGVEESQTYARALEEQKKQAAENLEKALRIQAEMENLRKRAVRDIENAHKYALEKFLGELLPVMDSIELGLSAVSESSTDISSLKEGMELTHKMLVSLMEKYGVKVIDPAGQKFNPEQHEAVSMLEQEGITSGHVISVMQKGYELNGRLVRPAMVVVAK